MDFYVKFDRNLTNCCSYRENRNLTVFRNNQCSENSSFSQTISQRGEIDSSSVIDKSIFVTSGSKTIISFGLRVANCCESKNVGSSGLKMNNFSGSKTTNSSGSKFTNSCVSDITNSSGLDIFGF